MSSQEEYNNKFLAKNLFPTDLCEKIANHMDYVKKQEKGRTSKEDHQITNDETVAMLNEFKPLHFEVTKYAEKFFKRKLIPTTDYSRIYAKGARLIPHDDSPHCECSMTINIKNSPEKNIWPFYVIVYYKYGNEEYRKDVAEFMMEQGDAVFYFGPDQIHWRNELEFENCYQLFLHWVDADGPNAHLGNKKYYEYNKV